MSKRLTLATFPLLLTISLVVGGGAASAHGNGPKSLGSAHANGPKSLGSAQANEPESAGLVHGDEPESPGGAASAPGKGLKSAATATGATICSFHGKLAANPDTTVSLAGNFTPHHGPACTSEGGAKFNTGHLSGTPLVSARGILTDLCSLVPGGGPLPNLSNGSIMWSPRPKVAASTGMTLTGGSVTTMTVGADTYVKIVYTGGAVGSGSFANASGVSLSATSREDLTTLERACGSGHVSEIALVGSLTL